MTSVVYPTAFWDNLLPSFFTDDSGGWVSSTPSVDFQLGISLFSRAPVFTPGDTFAEAPHGVPWGPDPNVLPPSYANGLYADPFWSLPVLPDGGVVRAAAYSSYIVDSTDAPLYRIIPESLTLAPDDPHFHDIPLFPFTGPVVAMAIWLHGVTSTSFLDEAILAIARFDSPLLMQGTEGTPSYVSIEQSMLTFTYSP